MSFRSWWESRQETARAREAVRYVNEWGLDSLSGRSPAQLREFARQMNHLAAHSHGWTRQSAKGLSQRAEHYAQRNATAKARDAARVDQKAMDQRARDIAEGKLPVNKVGTMEKQPDGSYAMTGWEFESPDGQDRELREGMDATEATGWSSQELHDMANRAASERAHQEFREQFFGTAPESPSPQGVIPRS